MKIRILSVNKQLDNKLITKAGFQDTISFSDFDVVVIDPLGLSGLWTADSRTAMYRSGERFTDLEVDLGFGSDLRSLFIRRQEEIGQVLEVSQGVVVCYFRNIETPLTLRSGNRGLLKLHNFSWLPAVSFSSTDRVGKTIRASFLLYEGFCLREGKEIGFVEKSHPFSRYFSGCENEIRYESILKPQAPWEKAITVISKNKVKEIISFEVSIGGGKIVFIPPVAFVEPAKEAGILIDCIARSMDRGYEGPPPAWIVKYSLPGEDKHSEQISGLDKKISELTDEKIRLEAEQGKIAKFKGLLYEKGKKGLEPLVRNAFRLIGFNVLEPDEYQEPYDLYIREKDLALVGEIAATDNSQIDMDKYRQLLEHVESESEKEAECKGILVANAFSDLDPQERKSQFTPHVTKACRKQGYCMITTITLFEIAKLILSKGSELNLEQLRKDILNCEQEFILK
jgi:hypothetical protein